MISTLSLWQWFKLISSFIFFLGPGLLFFIYYRNLQKFSLPVRLSLAFGLSLGFWILLLIWLQLFDVSLNSLIVRLLFSLLFFILLIQLFVIRGKILEWLKKKKNYPELLLIAFGILIILLYLYFYRNLVAGMGSDSMHHTLISSLFIENGQIPKDYGPYAPVVTFSYHFGYHAYITAMSLLSGITPRLMVVISGAILMGLASLAGGALVYYLTRRPLLGILSEAIIGIIYVFPSYSLLWGRYTQLMGTIMLMIYLLALIFWDHEKDFSLKFSPFLILITIGLIFSHYRICIAGIIFTIIYLIVRKDPLKMLKKHIVQWVFYPLSALILSSPWLIQLFIARQNGYEATKAQTAAHFYSMNRLGLTFKNETQTWILIGLSLISMGVGLIENKNHLKNLIKVFSLWVFILGALSQPLFLGENMDPVTLMISSYVPISLLISLGLSILSRILRKSFFENFLNSFIVLIVITGLISGINRWKNTDFENETYITSDDLQASEWIQTNIDINALFMINTFQFSLNENLIIGLDGGYWLPVIAERQTVIPPMGYLIEKIKYHNAEADVLKFHQLKGDLVGNQATNLLHEFGVGYVYVGARGGPIKFDKLNESNDFALIYQNKGVSIFEIIE